MSLPVVWIDAARSELYEAVRRYTSIRPELGTRFARAVERTVAEIANGPLLFAAVRGEVRRAGIRQFPYGLYFLAEEHRLVVLACFHGKRDPRVWQRRSATG